MNNPELVAMLTIGTVLMCFLISVQMKWYGVRRWKSIVVAATLLLTGVFGSRVWYYIENGYFQGRSLYGAIVFSPLAFWPVARFLKIPYGETMDFVAPAGCLTLALVKIQCLRDGCCVGMALYIDKNHNYVLFPSQIVEMAVFFVIAGTLLWMSSKRERRTEIFPWFMVLYGVSRFILDYFRQGRVPFMLGLSAGSFWSLFLLLVGIVVLFLVKRKQQAIEKNM